MASDRDFNFRGSGFTPGKGLVSLSLSVVSLGSRVRNAAMDAILIGARAVIKYLKKGCDLADSAAAAPLKALMKVNHNSLPQFSFNFEIIKDSAASVT